MGGKAFVVKGADYSSLGFGKVNFTGSIPLRGLSINDGIATEDENVFIYGVTYVPSNTSDKGVEWSIIDGAEYATIDENGQLTILKGAELASVTIKATSLINPQISATKQIVVTYIDPYYVKELYDNKRLTTNGLSDLAGYYATDYIPIEPGAVIVFTQMWDRISLYDANKVQLNSWSISASGTTVTIPSNGAFIRVGEKKTANSAAEYYCTRISFEDGTYYYFHPKFGLFGKWLIVLDDNVTSITWDCKSSTSVFLGFFDAEGKKVSYVSRKNQVSTINVSGVKYLAAIADISGDGFTDNNGKTYQATYNTLIR